MYRVIAIVLFLTASLANGQEVSIDKPQHPAPPPVPVTPPQPAPEPGQDPSTASRSALEFDRKEIKFGAQGVGIQSCQYIVVKNTSDQAQIIAGLTTTDPKHFSIPSPTQAMLPITLRRGGTLTLSVCFAPDKVGAFNTTLSLRTGHEVLVLPVTARGIKTEDVAKLPQTELIIKAPKKKKKEWTIDLKMPKAAKLLMQLLDPLGNPIKTYINNEIMNEGNYEFIFAGTDSQGAPLDAGTYYIRMTGAELYTNKEVKITKMISYKP